MSHCRVHLHEANTRTCLILNIRIPLKNGAWPVADYCEFASVRKKSFCAPRSQSCNSAVGTNLSGNIFAIVYQDGLDLTIWINFNQGIRTEDVVKITFFC